AFQHDFAARMDWTIRDPAHANHPPRVVVNQDASDQPLVLDVAAGASVTLDARASRDPDGNGLGYQWFHYAEAGAEPDVSLAAVTLQGAREPVVTVRADDTCRPNWLASQKCGKSGVAHIILAVTDNGTPALTRYRRVILRISGG
ncbi:MAG: hypothetical protein RLZZ200_1722, partial [Pseudomonadota bacterium]